MKDLLQALNIFNKYFPECEHPFHCEHDILITNFIPADMTREDRDTVEDLGFFIAEEHDGAYCSYKYGSC